LITSTFNNYLSVTCLRSTIALYLHMRSACCSIAWFPGIVPVGFLLAEVRPLQYTSKLEANPHLEVVQYM